MKKVLIVASVISFIEWFNQENVDYLHRDLECEVHIACNLEYMNDTDEERTLRYLDRLRAEGVKLHNIPFARSPLSLSNLTAYRMLRKLIRTESFDLIHCHTPAASVYTRLAARNARHRGTTVMYTCHGFHFHNASAKINWLLYYPIERFLSLFCDYLVTINHEDYQRAKTFHCKNVRYIPGVGVDLKRYYSESSDRSGVRKELGIPENAVMLISIGELISRKNHQVILKAIAKLQRTDVFCVICGKGEQRDSLTALAEKLNIRERLILPGFRKDIPRLCKAADIGVFPSKTEGLGLAGIEMLAAGLPLVSSNVHGIMDYVEDGVNGFACDPDDPAAFASAIEKLISNDMLRYEMKNRSPDSVKRYDLPNALSAMREIYEEILMQTDLGVAK